MISIPDNEMTITHCIHSGRLGLDEALKDYTASIDPFPRLAQDNTRNNKYSTYAIEMIDKCLVDSSRSKAVKPRICSSDSQTKKLLTFWGLCKVCK